MNLTLGVANKLLEDLMTNYSQWHTERAPTCKKVNSVEEVSSSSSSSSLSDKIDMLASLLSKQVPIDPNNVPLNSLVANENDQVDVNFIARHNFNNSAYKNNFGGNNYSPYPPNMVICMEIIMAMLTTILKVPPLILKTCLKNLSLHKKI